MHDYAMTSSFLRILTSSDDEAITFQTFDDTETKDNRLAKWRHSERSTEIFGQLKKLQSRGAGVYIMVNQGDGKGRSVNNVVAVRSLFIDLDGSPWEPSANMLRPHMRVETSPGRYHLYWLVSDCQLDQFKQIQQAIAKKFNGDKSCVDLARVLRLPGFQHQKKEPVLCKLMEANDFIKYTTQQVIDGLQLDIAGTKTLSAKQPESIEGVFQQSVSEVASSSSYEFTDPATGEVYDLVSWATQNPTFDLVAAVDLQYHRGNPRNDGKQHIRCPFEDQHTDQGQDLATFVARASPAHPAFTIQCMHSHCADRDRLEFIHAMLEKGWMSLEALLVGMPPTFETRRPLWVTYQTNEILAAPEWATLLPDERRIALDLMVMAWAEIDGMIANDDWAIARRLDMPEDKWLSYRETLSRTGWLIEINGRLTNSIVKREFDNAQKAYMDSIRFGSIGGKISAAKRKNSTPP